MVRSVLNASQKRPCRASGFVLEPKAAGLKSRPSLMQQTIALANPIATLQRSHDSGHSV